MKTSLALTGSVHRELYNHLYPGDGLEAAAVALCGRSSHNGEMRLLVHEIIKIPYEECDRFEGLLRWPTNRIIPYFEMVMKKNMAILKLHSHPGGYDQFSETDDESDIEFFESVYGWSDTSDVHGSAIMLPDGKIFGRTVSIDGHFLPFKKVSVVGDDIKVWWTDRSSLENEQFSLRTQQAFGPGTVELIRRLRIGVVGCSGTGSPLIEQLVRLGVGEIVLVDPDNVEEKNLNRILNTTKSDALNQRKKVDVLKASINAIGIGTHVDVHASNIFDQVAILKDLATCDVIFGCMDSVDGRHLLNHLTAFYLIPYFDLGVRLSANGIGGIDQIHSTVHYLQPDKGSLLTRGVYTNEGLRAAGLLRTNPKEYEDLKRSGYIVNADVQSPAVISINMLIASTAVNEFLARIHSFRNEDNSEFEISRYSVTDGYFLHEKDTTVDVYLKRFCGRGDMQPFLNMPELSNK